MKKTEINLVDDLKGEGVRYELIYEKGTVDRVFEDWIHNYFAQSWTAQKNNLKQCHDIFCCSKLNIRG